jgi:hypothetical protein
VRVNGGWRRSWRRELSWRSSRLREVLSGAVPSGPPLLASSLIFIEGMNQAGFGFAG